MMQNRSTETLICDVSLLFEASVPADVVEVVAGENFQRHEWESAEAFCVTRDTFANTGVSCAFVRFYSSEARTIDFRAQAGYQVASCPAGGWILKPTSGNQEVYWISQPPKYRLLDKGGHIISEKPASISGHKVTAADLSLQVAAHGDHYLDCVIWQLPAGEPDIVSDLEQLAGLEVQPIFTWSSHTVYQRPADVYLHLVNGHVYENHTVWPRYWKVCSELDAHALYVTLSGLELATGKRLYALLKQQITLSVIARQAEDGGWYHGEWTDHMEAHYRLHGGAMHLLAAALEERPDEVVRSSLRKAAEFISSRASHIDAGVWFLHDSLEHSQEAMKLCPFRWVSSRALGKTPENLLVLNTHLDTSIALERYGEVTGDRRYDDQVASARAATRVVVNRRPAQWLYRPLFWAIGLTLLPTSTASRLPLLKRAIKRVAWKYLIPWLPFVKAKFPRLVMPGGHIERDLSLRGWSDQYESVTLMDLLRYHRRFPEEGTIAALQDTLSFTQKSGIRERWKEVREKDHALGFWVEALYHLCTLSRESLYRRWLAEAVFDAEELGIGLPPSVLGANPEVVAKRDQIPCPSPTNVALRVINLSCGGHMEILVVNPTSCSLHLAWQTGMNIPLRWMDAGGMPEEKGSDGAPVVPARGWLWGRSLSLDAG